MHGLFTYHCHVMLGTNSNQTCRKKICTHVRTKYSQEKFPTGGSGATSYFKSHGWLYAHILPCKASKQTKLGCWNCNRVRFLPIRCMKREAEWASISFVCIIKPSSPLPELETSRAFFMKQRPTSVNFSYRFQNFVSRLSCVQNPYAQLHHFGGVNAAA